MKTRMYVRIDQQVKSTLQAIASEKKMSLNALIDMILSDYAQAPAVRKVEDQYGKLLKDITALYTHQSEELADVISENTEVLKDVRRRMKGGR